MAVLCMGMTGYVHADGEVAATPYRPTVSNPAELSAPGWLELEAGWAHATGDGPSRLSLPYTAKLAFTQDWGVLLGGELWVHERDDGTSTSGHGDTSFTVKHRIATGDEHQNFGIEAGTKLPTARRGLGSGKPDWTVNGIYSLDFAENWRLDANLGVTRQGAPDAGQGRLSTLWAAALSRGSGAWTLAGELSGTHQTGTDDSVQAMAAAAYALTPRIVLDTGMSSTWQGSQRQQTLFVGVTWLAGKMF